MISYTTSSLSKACSLELSALWVTQWTLVVTHTVYNAQWQLGLKWKKSSLSGLGNHESEAVKTLNAEECGESQTKNQRISKLCLPTPLTHVCAEQTQIKNTTLRWAWNCCPRNRVWSSGLARLISCWRKQHSLEKTGRILNLHQLTLVTLKIWSKSTQHTKYQEYGRRSPKKVKSTEFHSKMNRMLELTD